MSDYEVKKSKRFLTADSHPLMDPHLYSGREHYLPQLIELLRITHLTGLKPSEVFRYLHREPELVDKMNALESAHDIMSSCWLRPAKYVLEWLRNRNIATSTGASVPEFDAQYDLEFHDIETRRVPSGDSLKPFVAEVLRETGESFQEVIPTLYSLGVVDFKTMARLLSHFKREYAKLFRDMRHEGLVRTKGDQRSLGGAPIPSELAARMHKLGLMPGSEGRPSMMNRITAFSRVAKYYMELFDLADKVLANTP